MKTALIAPTIFSRPCAAVLFTLTFLSAVLLGVVSAKAATYNWTSANSDGYTNTADWSPNGLPGISDTAIIGNVTQPNGSVVYTNLPPDPASTNRLSLLQMGTAAGTSTFNMTGGVLWITNASSTAFSLGDASGAVSTFTQSGGTVVVARPSTANLYYQDAFLPGGAAGGNGAFTINNGLLDIFCGCEIASSGSGAFNLNGGIVVDNGWFGLRGGSTASDSGMFNMTGGTLYVLRNSEIEGQSFQPLAFGQGGYNSTANVSGGTAYFESVTFGNNANCNETLNMSGGTLYIGFAGVISRGAAASQAINISGGTFHTADMQIISTTANVGNTNTILSDGTNWSWGATLPVNLTNSTFTVNGQSGLGYVTFAPETNRTITLKNQWSGVGGLVLNGPGNLALGGSNTYTGGTTIDQGNLILDTGGSVVDSTLNIPSGSSLVFSNSSAVTFTNIVTGAGDVVVTGPGALNLESANTYTGPTILGGGSSIILGANASISDSSLIYLTPSSSTLNVGAPGAFALGNGQTLEGAGTIDGNVTANTGSIITPGTNATTYGTITFANNLTLNGDTNYMKISDNNNVGVDNDLISVQQNLTLSGVSTFYISPLATLNSSSPYTLIEADGGITGETQNVQIVLSTTPRYTVSPVIGTDLNNQPALMLSVSGNAAPLEWEGYLTHNWDLMTSNWFNMSTSSHDHFYDSDNPTFDDAASVTAVVVTNNVVVSGMNMSNVVNSYTFSGGGIITGPLNLEGNGSGAGGTTILATSNAPVFTTIDASFGTLVYNLTGLTNYTVAASMTDSNGSGTATIIFGGTNTVTLGGNNLPAPVILGSYNPDFDGTIMVTNGILQYTNVNSLGVDASVNGSPSFAPIIVTNNGTLNFNGVAAGASFSAPVGGEKWIHISGAGYNGQGALTDKQGASNADPNSGAFCFLYLDGNATIGCPTSTRYDQHVLSGNAQQVEGNGYNVTFVGQGVVTFYGQSDGDMHFGNIDVQTALPGRPIFQNGPLALGPSTNYLTVESNSCVTFYDVTNNNDPIHGGINKILWLKGNATLDSGGATAKGNTNNYIGPVFLTGTNWIGTRVGLYLWNSIIDTNGPGGFILGNTVVGNAGGPLWLEGTNTYSGPTIVSNQTLFVGANSSLGLSTCVQVNSGATLDLSATPSYNFGTTQTNQTMSGNGTVIGPASGNLTFNAGSTLAVGLPATNGLPQTNTFTLTMNNSVVFNSGSTNYVVANKASPSPGAVPADKVSGLTSLTLGGTLVVTNFGTSFVAGDSLALFSATTITTNSTFNVLPATPGPNLAWNYSTFLTAGTLQVSSSSSVNPNPTKITVQISGGQITLGWPADHIGWQLQALTNTLRVGIVTNVPIGNNWANYNPSIGTNKVVIPVNLTNGTVFYRLVY
jgi:autotransporter-associated beta strand protein